MYGLQALLPGLVAAGVTLLLTPAVMRLALHLRAVDVPGGRKRHGESIPRLGGIAIVSGIVISLVPGLLLLSDQSIHSLSQSEVFWFTLATLIIFVLGLVDDMTGGLGAVKKLAVEVLAASVVVALGWQFTALRLPVDGLFHVGGLAPILSVLWIVGVTNAINFIDGLDGLAAGIVAIISSSLLILAILQNNPDTVIVTSCIVGTCLGFLRHNWRPAQIYMGDSGSLTLGFMLATISLGSSPSVKASATVAILVPILALGLPVFDTLLVMWYRFLRGHHLVNRVARMLHADRAHIHHLLLDNHAERPKVMLILYGLAMAFCAMALTVAVSGNWWLGLGFLGVEFAAVLLIRRAGLNAEARRLAEERLMGLPERLPADPSNAVHTRLRREPSVREDLVATGRR